MQYRNGPPLNETKKKRVGGGWSPIATLNPQTYQRPKQSPIHSSYFPNHRHSTSPNTTASFKCKTTTSTRITKHSHPTISIPIYYSSIRLQVTNRNYNQNTVKNRSYPYAIFSAKFRAMDNTSSLEHKPRTFYSSVCDGTKQKHRDRT